MSLAKEVKELLEKDLIHKGMKVRCLVTLDMKDDAKDHRHTTRGKIYTIIDRDSSGVLIPDDNNGRPIFLDKGEFEVI